jgi:transcription elongation factor GreA
LDCLRDLPGELLIETSITKMMTITITIDDYDWLAGLSHSEFRNPQFPPHLTSRRISGRLRTAISTRGIDMPTYMIQSTLDRLRLRLQDIQKEKYEIAKELQVAAGHGDFSENAELDAAREKKEMLALEELRIKGWLADAQLIEQLKLPPDVVTVGKKLKIQDLESGEEQTYALLGEMDKWEGLPVLSITAPLAAGLLNKKKGRTAEVQLPRQVKRYKIVELDDLFQ